MGRATTMMSINCVLVAMALLFTVSDAAGQLPEVEAVAVADSLVAEGDLYRAISEYKHVLYASDDCKSRSRAVVGIASTLYRGEQYLRAVGWLDRKGSVLLATDRKFADEIYLTSLFRTRLAEDLLRFSRTLDGAMSLYGVALAGCLKEEWGSAQGYFERVEEASPYHARARSAVEVCQRAAKIGRKNPSVAGTLGVIPGAGYLYSGHPQTALAAAVVNSAFIFSAYQAFDSGNIVLGTTLAFWSFLWYGGSIVGSVQAAERHNEAVRNGLWKDLE